MSLSHLPPYVSALFYALAHCLDRRLQGRFPQLLRVVQEVQPADTLTVAIDDTPTPRWGPCVEGAGIHHNPNPGPAGEKYVYGHVWVTLAALVPHADEGSRAWPLRA